MNGPELYNIALDCVDKNAQSLHNKHKTAMIAVGRDFTAKKLTFSNLEGLTNRIANALRELGFKQGERLLLRLGNGMEFPVTFLGAIKAGLIPIPISPLLTWHELQFLLEDSESAVFVTSLSTLPPELLKEKPECLRKTLLLTPPGAPLPPDCHRWEDLLKNASSDFKTENTPADSPAFWLYTSGTEGKPKAVIHAHRSIPAHDGRARLWQDVKADDLIFNTSALHWSYALTCGMLDLWRHGLPTLIYSGELSAEKITRLVKQFGVTIFMSVPGIYRRLGDHLRENDDAFSKVRICLSAGEKLGEETRKRFRTLAGLDIYEGLGMTEHSVYLVQRYGDPIVPKSCGQAVPGATVSILRENLSEAKPGETGILASHRSCPGLMLGYYRRPEEEAAAFKGDWFLSGDLASLDEAGNFFFEGRRDDVITSGGYRISPLEVERVLNECDLVQESAVVGAEGEAGQTWVRAFVVLNQKGNLSKEAENQIRLHAEKHLAKFKTPREMIVVDSLPKTESGKIKRKELKRKG
ncbi:MAG: acyl-CoA synthetase [bacterium]